MLREHSERRYDPAKVPEALEKATGDPFDYALGLRNGTVIRFESATIDAICEWVHIDITHNGDHGMEGSTFIFERGLDLRISEIAWVADAPMGS